MPTRGHAEYVAAMRRACRAGRRCLRAARAGEVGAASLLLDEFGSRVVVAATRFTELADAQFRRLDRPLSREHLEAVAAEVRAEADEGQRWRRRIMRLERAIGAAGESLATRMRALPGDAAPPIRTPPP